MVNESLTIKVDRERLLTALEINRDGHRAQYEKAKAGYIKETTAQVKEYLTRLADGQLLERAYLPAPPEDHTGDYSDVIEMMAWSRDDHIEMTQAQFKQYVLDQWGWRSQWIASNSTYLAQG